MAVAFDSLRRRKECLSLPLSCASCTTPVHAQPCVSQEARTHLQQP